MAISWDSFDKIWASTSPLTPYEFSDPNYSQGWNFVGSTPPARQMWDSIQKQNDEKFKYLRDNFGTPNIVTSSSQMTDTEKVYVYMGSEAGWNSGHWYYWDGSAWADGGVYNSVAFITDTTLSIAGQPADAKATGDAISVKADASIVPVVDPTLTISGAAADAKVTGDITAEIGKNGVARFDLDFEWTSGYIDYSGNIVESESYQHSKMISSEDFYAMKLTTVALLEVWAYNADGSFYGKRSNIPANSVDYTPTSGWLSSGAQCRLVVATANAVNVKAYVPKQVLAKQSEYKLTKATVDYESLYLVQSDKRYTYSQNLFDSSVAITGYYVSETTGELIASANMFASGFIKINTVGDYSFIVRSGSPIVWNKPSNRYYAFYDKDFHFTHGGVASVDEDVTSIQGDEYCRISYYTSAMVGVMFGLKSDLASYVGINTDTIPYAVYPTASNQLSASIFIANPYYSLRVAGDRISTSKNGEKAGAFIRFDSLSVLGFEGWKSKTWADFKTDVASDPSALLLSYAYDFTPDVLQLPPQAGIIYNYATNTCHVKKTMAPDYLSKLETNEVLLIYVDVNSEPSGLLYESWYSKKSNGIKNYIRTIEEKETDLLGAGSDFTFAFATDCHWYFDNTAYKNYTNEMIEQLRQVVGFDCYINGGDSIYHGTKFKLNGISCMGKAFEPSHDNIVYCVGNHDFNGVSGLGAYPQENTWMFDDAGFETMCMRKLQNIHRPAGKRYYYRDFEDKKVRVISLDTSDVPPITFNEDGELTSADPLLTAVIRQDQIDWLCNTALNCPDDDWCVVVVMHIGVYLPEDGFTDNANLINRQAIISILKAYVQKSSYSYSVSSTYPVSGSGSFASYHGSLVGVWSGHAHADGYCNEDGFNAIQTDCGYPAIRARSVGTIDEICVDCVSIDKTNKTVKLTRFGVGSDRSYTFI